MTSQTAHLAHAAAESVPAAAIRAEGLTRLYGGRRAVDGITFSVAPGEILGLLGPNGAGKTTTMRMLAGYIPANAGRAEIAGFDIARQSRSAREKLGYLPEHAPLYLDMDVRAYLGFMAEVKHVPRAARRGAVDTAIEECGLGEAAGRTIGLLSRGFRQRVGLAQAILGDPAVLILDEPTVGLDPRQIAEIRQLIRGMAGRRAVLLSTHILPEVAMVCQRVIVMNRGRIAAQGTPDRLETAAGKSPRQWIELVIAPRAIESRRGGGGAGAGEHWIEDESKAALSLIERVRGVTHGEVEPARQGRLAFRVTCHEDADPRPALAKALVGEGFGIVGMALGGGSLEDVFLQLISEEA